MLTDGSEVSSLRLEKEYEKLGGAWERPEETSPRRRGLQTLWEMRPGHSMEHPAMWPIP